MKKRFHPIDLSPVMREQVSAAVFGRIAKERPYAIARSRFVPPRIGANDFGAFEVEYRIPLLREVAHG